MRKYTVRLRKKEIEEFWAFVTVKKKSECWSWMGVKQSMGYGSLRISGKKLLAHRVAYAAENGTIPEGKCICHKCDNPICVNPSHLWAGTPQQNAYDREIKKRGNHIKGTTPRKLKGALAKRIRNLYSTGKYTQAELAVKFSVKLTAISKLIRGITYKNE